MNCNPRWQEWVRCYYRWYAKSLNGTTGHEGRFDSWYTCTVGLHVLSFFLICGRPIAVGDQLRRLSFFEVCTCLTNGVLIGDQAISSGWRDNCRVFVFLALSCHQIYQPWLSFLSVTFWQHVLQNSARLVLIVVNRSFSVRYLLDKEHCH